MGIIGSSVQHVSAAVAARFPVIANRCNFELWFVSAWLVALGVGLMQVVVQLLVIAFCAHKYQKATTPEAAAASGLSC